MKQFNSIKKVLIFGWCIFLNLSINAQEILPINFETVLKLCNANNLTIKEYQLHQEIAKADLLKAKEWWLPNVYGGLRTHQLWGAAMNTDGRFALDLERDNLWAGLGLEANWNFGEGIFKHKTAKLQCQAAEMQTKAERNKVILKAIKTYYEFLSAQLQYQSYEELAKQADTLAQQIEVQVEAGLGYESDRLLSKSQANHIKVQMLDAKINWQTQEAYLKKILLLQPDIQLVSIDTFFIPIEASIEKENINYETAYAKRPEIKLIELNRQALQTAKKTATIGLILPELRLNIYAAQAGDLNNTVTPLDASQYPNPSQLYPTQAVNAALLWEIPLGTILYQGEIKQFNAKIALSENRLAQQKAIVNEEVIVYKAAMESAKEQIELAKEGSQYAEEALNQSFARQQLGIIRPFEILQTQEIFIQNRLDYVQAMAKFNTAYYRYLVAMGEDL